MRRGILLPQKKFATLKKSLIFTVLLLSVLVAKAQKTIVGTVIDEITGEPVVMANVFFDDGVISQTDFEGKFTKEYQRSKLHVACVGYNAKTISIKHLKDTIEVTLLPLENTGGKAIVKGKKQKYDRKNNPAVELMKKVIANKKQTDLHSHDYFSYEKYTKMVFAFNEVTEQSFESGIMKPFSFMKDGLEVCNATGKLTLPISIDETSSTQVWRKKTNTEKTIITGQRTKGLKDILKSTGEMFNVILKDCFTDVDIYEDEIRLLQYPFLSPISSKNAIGFYRYFLGDTINIGIDRCVDVTFTPNNSQDFGFSGHLYVVVSDSSYRVKHLKMGIPYRSDVNFVKDMQIIQTYAQLPTGEHVIEQDEMIIQMELTNFLHKFQVTRDNYYSHFDFGVIPDRTFKFDGDTRTEANALMRDEQFWDDRRANNLNNDEEAVNRVVTSVKKAKGYKVIMPIIQAVMENFIETGSEKTPSKIDIGPVVSSISSNKVEGLRLRASAQTTANLNPHLFFKGYMAYGVKDHRWKGALETIYSFNKKAYRPHEFPRHNLTFAFKDDVISPSDQFLGPDKDNVFKALKWTTIDHMYYVRSFDINYVKEWGNGLQIWGGLYHERMEPTLEMFFQPTNLIGPSQNPADHIKYIHKSEAEIGIQYQPGVTWINTKQNRYESNYDAPILRFKHRFGFKNVLSSEHASNLTEASIYKRFWVGSWGKIDLLLRGDIQWNKVPYPYLILPSADLSYFMEDGTFSLVDNMEFLSDRALSFFGSWDMNGKILNRIPLIRKLKWRELFGCNVLWGHLTSKNDPFVNPDDPDLFFFPGRFNENGEFRYLSRSINSSKPYVEVYAGVHNVFKFFRIEYFRRLTYLSNPDTHRWGIRFKFEFSF